jgi:hypothetical protein
MDVSTGLTSYRTNAGLSTFGSFCQLHRNLRVNGDWSNSTLTDVQSVVPFDGSLTQAVQESVGSSGEVPVIDAAPEMIEIARKKNTNAGTAITFQVGQIDKVPYLEAEFDVAIPIFLHYFWFSRVNPLKNLLEGF